MDFRRIIKHSWFNKLHVHQLFPGASLDRITKAITATEAKHHGEIRFAVEASLHWGALLKKLPARERAIQVFGDLRIWDTEENNGVLIYLLLADRDVEIVADRGVHAKVGTEGWESICRMMEEEFRRGRFEIGVIRGIEAVGAHLENHFPRRGEDKNELPDRPVIL